SASSRRGDGCVFVGSHGGGAGSCVANALPADSNQGAVHQAQPIGRLEVVAAAVQTGHEAAGGRLERSTPAVGHSDEFVDRLVVQAPVTGQFDGSFLNSSGCHGHPPFVLGGSCIG